MRPLGKHGMQASAQGLGCMSLSKGFYHEEQSLGPEEDRMGVIREALSSGLTLLDTADAYGPYDNQILIGKQSLCNSLHAHSLAQQMQLGKASRSFLLLCKSDRLFQRTARQQTHWGLHTLSSLHSPSLGGVLSVPDLPLMNSQAVCRQGHCRHSPRESSDCKQVGLPERWQQLESGHQSRVLQESSDNSTQEPKH